MPNAPRLTPERLADMAIPNARERLEWLEDQFTQQLAACSPGQRDTWKRHIEAARAGIDAMAKLDAVTRERDAALRDPLTGATYAENFAKIRAVVERISARGNVVDSHDVAGLATVLLLCPTSSDSADA